MRPTDIAGRARELASAVESTSSQQAFLERLIKDSTENIIEYKFPQPLLLEGYVHA